MAITRLLQTGLEEQNLSLFFNIVYTNINYSPTISTTSPKTGTYCLRLRYYEQFYCAVEAFTPPTYQVRCGFDHYGLGCSATASAIFSIGSSVRLDIDNTGSLKLYNSGLVGTTTVAEGYKHIGIDYKADASSGWLNLYIDGILKVSKTGNTGASVISLVRFGKYDNVDLNSTGYLYYDNIYIDDTTGEASAAAPPRYRFHLATPNGNGNYSQFDGSDGNSVDNYALVDEIPPVATDYVSTAVANELDSYTISSVTPDENEFVTAVIPIAYCTRRGTTEQIALGTRLSGTDSIGSDQNPGTSKNLLFERQTAKPGGGAWSNEDIENVEMVIKSRGAY